MNNFEKIKNISIKIYSNHFKVKYCKWLKVCDQKYAISGLFMSGKQQYIFKCPKTGLQALVKLLVTEKK